MHRNPELAIFADRDGTLIRHADYLSDPDQVELLPGVKDTIHELISREHPFFHPDESIRRRPWLFPDRASSCLSGQAV